MTIAANCPSADPKFGGVTMPVFNIPRLEDVAIDGTGNNWGGRGLQVEVMTDEAGRTRAVDDFDPQFRLGWDDDGLLVLVTVRTVGGLEAAENALSTGSSVECFVASAPGCSEQYQVMIAPGLDPKFPSIRRQFFDLRTSLAGPLDIEVASSATEDGYRLEMRFPWRNLHQCGQGTATQGDELGFQLYVTQSAGSERPFSAVWFPRHDTAGNPESMHRLRLAGKFETCGPLDVAAVGGYEGSALGATVRVTTSSSARAGQAVELRDGVTGDSLATGRLDDSGNGRLTARFSLPLPPVGQTYPPLTVLIDGQAIATPILLSNSDKRRQEAFANARIIFDPFVFTGNPFPECEFEHPAQVKELIGAYRLKTTFYANDFQQVHSAKLPGRYGAIVEVHTAAGAILKRYVTLYKQLSPVDWRSTELPLSVPELPDGLGLSPEVVQGQQGTVAEFFKKALVASFAGSDAAAAFLSTMAETKPDSLRTNNARFGFVVPGTWWDGLRAHTGNLYQPQYLSWLPSGYERSDEKRWPLIIFLHGAGERGNDLQQVRKNGLAKHVSEHNDLPAIVIAPQCPTDDWWLPSALNRMLDEVIAKYRVDLDRIYLTGLSMGGFGTRQWSIANPERFAALVPVCGGGDPDGAERIKGLPIWAFHGGRDQVVPLRASECMVEAVQAAGGNVKLTVYPELEHDSWTAAYSEPELYPWLLSHRRASI